MKSKHARMKRHINGLMEISLWSCVSNLALIILDHIYSWDLKLHHLTIQSPSELRTRHLRQKHRILLQYIFHTSPAYHEMLRNWTVSIARPIEKPVSMPAHHWGFQDRRLIYIALAPTRLGSPIVRRYDKEYSALRPGSYRFLFD